MLSSRDRDAHAHASASFSSSCPRLARGTALIPPSSNSPASDAALDRPSGALAAPIARELRGDLPCVRCKYNLKGLTVKGMCPECGTSVRTTLLAVVDPMARELRPIFHPALTSMGLVVWSSAALLAALSIWLLRAEDFLSRPRAASPAQWLPFLVVGFSALSGLAATALVAPHEDIPPRQRWAAMLGVSAYVPLVFFLFLLHVRFDPTSRPPYGYQAEILHERLILRFCISFLLVAILLLLRPNARLLSGRWVLMRIGAVDRQAMLSMSIVVAVWTLGDLLRLLATYLQGTLADVIRFVGAGSVLLGSLLFTVGLASVVLDSWRLRPILAQPPLDLEDLTDASPPHSNNTIPNP